MGEVDCLHAELRAFGRPEIGHADLAQAARRAWPDLDMRSALSRLPGALSSLKAEGAVRYPEARSSWHRGGIVALPHSVKLAKPRKQAASPPAPFAWHPDLAAASRLPETRRKEVLRRLSVWLSAKGTPPVDLVPYRTRSAQIAGDEKAFDDCGLIAGDRVFGIPLARIGAYAPTDVLKVIRVEAAPAAILVVENDHSFHAVADANRLVKAYGAIVSGQGNNVSSQPFARALAGLAEELDARIDYFGDVDVNGIAMGLRLRDNLTLLSAPTCEPCLPLYEALCREPPKSGGRVGGRVGPWLPPDLSATVASAFGRGQWWPQELCDRPDILDALQSTCWAS